MAKQQGRALLIKLYNGTSFVTVAGLRTKSLTLNDEEVDSSDSDSAGRWREILAEAGMRSMSFTGSGLLESATAQKQVLTAFMAGQNVSCQVVLPGVGTFEGPYHIGSFEAGGEYNGAATFSTSFSSAGELTFTAS